jgi:hypothetical protein
VEMTISTCGMYWPWIKQKNFEKNIEKIILFQILRNQTSPFWESKRHVFVINKIFKKEHALSHLCKVFPILVKIWLFYVLI